MQPFGAPAAPAGLGPPRVLMLMLMVIVVVVRSHTLGRYCFLLHQLASRSALALHQPEENRWEPPTPDPVAAALGADARGEVPAPRVSVAVFCFTNRSLPLQLAAIHN